MDAVGSAQFIFEHCIKVIKLLKGFDASINLRASSNFTCSFLKTYLQSLRPTCEPTYCEQVPGLLSVCPSSSASKSSIRRFVITEKAPTRVIRDGQVG